MNLLIPVRNNPHNWNLKYAIRSICQHNTIERCLIVGGKPDWYTGEHIPHKDYATHLTAHNIRDKTYAGALILNDFLFANDDHFVLAPYPGVHNKGLLSETIKGRQPNGSYTRLLVNTLKRFGDVPNTDTHCPMEMSLTGVELCMFDWPDWGIGFKTCYTEMNKIPSTYYPDNKVSEVPQHPTGLYFSTSRYCARLERLQVLFPIKSSFEV